MTVLKNPVSRGKLWGPGYTWGQAIEAHAEHCASGCVRFLVTDVGIWMEGDGSRAKIFGTKLPVGAEAYAKTIIEDFKLVASSRDPRYIVGPKYA